MLWPKHFTECRINVYSLLTKLHCEYKHRERERVTTISTLTVLLAYTTHTNARIWGTKYLTNLNARSLKQYLFGISYPKRIEKREIGKVREHRLFLCHILCNGIQIEWFLLMHTFGKYVQFRLCLLLSDRTHIFVLRQCRFFIAAVLCVDAYLDNVLAKGEWESPL